MKKIALRRIAATTLAVAATLMPAGIAAGAASAQPWHGGDYFGRDCDHNGHFFRQYIRGQWINSDCDLGRGRWEQRNGQWMWHHLRG